MNGLFARALIAFIALPGVVAYLVPTLIVERDQPFQREGLAPLVAGTALLLWCVREFSVAGRGTLAPWTPPRHLVVSGLYRYSRNPMYVGVAVVLAGWALAYRSRTLAIYAAVVIAAFHLRVVLFEEPWLARTHGDAWVRYRASVPRWFGLRRNHDAP
jgi:protein-S-isoprenylcysteine O-methyltransferase Ste14